MSIKPEYIELDHAASHLLCPFYPPSLAEQIYWVRELVELQSFVIEQITTEGRERDVFSVPWVRSNFSLMKSLMEITSSGHLKPEQSARTFPVTKMVIVYCTSRPEFLGIYFEVGDAIFQDTQPKVTTPEKIQASRTFHGLWTSCVGRPGYMKHEWQLVEQQLVRGGVIG